MRTNNKEIKKKEMATFKFYQDVEAVVTRREYYTIEAETIEQARELASGVCNLDDCDEAEYDGSELLLDDDGYSDGKVYGIYDEDGEEID